MQSPKRRKLSNTQHAANSRVAERVAPQASLAPSQAPLAMGALSERLVPPFLQSVHSPASITFPKPLVFTKPRLVPPFLQSVHSPASITSPKPLVFTKPRLVPPFLQSVHSPTSSTFPGPLVFKRPRLAPPFAQNALPQNKKYCYFRTIVLNTFTSNFSRVHS